MISWPPPFSPLKDVPLAFNYSYFNVHPRSFMLKLLLVISCILIFDALDSFPDLESSNSYLNESKSQMYSGLKRNLYPDKQP